MISLCLFRSSFHLNPKPGCPIYIWTFWVQYLSILFICIFWESYWKCASFGRNFAQFWVVLEELWPFQGWLSLRNLIPRHNVLLHIVKSVLVQSFRSAYCWKAIDIVLLLVLVFFSSQIRVALANIWPLEVWWSLRSWFQDNNLHLHIMRSLLIWSL